MLARYLSSSPSSLCFSLLLVLSVHRMCSQPFLILLLHLGSAVVLGVQRRAPQLLAPRYLPTSSFSSSSCFSSFSSLPPSVPPSHSPPPLLSHKCHGVLFNATGNKIEVNIHDNSSLGKSVSPPTQSPFRVGEGVATSIMLWATFITRPPQSRR